MKYAFTSLVVVQGVFVVGVTIAILYLYIGRLKHRLAATHVVLLGLSYLLLTSVLLEHVITDLTTMAPHRFWRAIVGFIIGDYGLIVMLAMQIRRRVPS